MKKIILKSGHLQKKSIVKDRENKEEYEKNRSEKLTPKLIPSGLYSQARGGLMISLEVGDGKWVRVEAAAETPCKLGEEGETIKDMYKVSAKAVEEELRDAIELIKRL